MTIDISDIDETFRKFFCRAGYWSLYKTNILVLTYFAVSWQFWMIWYRGRWWMKSNFCNATSQSHTIVASLGIQQQLFLRYISRLLHNTSTIGLSHRSRVPKANPIPRLGSSKALLDCDIIVNKSQLSSISNSILLFNFYMEPFKKRYGNFKYKSQHFSSCACDSIFVFQLTPKNLQMRFAIYAFKTLTWFMKFSFQNLLWHLKHSKLLQRIPKAPFKLDRVLISAKWSQTLLLCLHSFLKPSKDDKLSLSTFCIKILRFPFEPLFVGGGYYLTISNVIYQEDQWSSWTKNLSCRNLKYLIRYRTPFLSRRQKEQMEVIGEKSNSHVTPKYPF